MHPFRKWGEAGHVILEEILTHQPNMGKDLRQQRALDDQYQQRPVPAKLPGWSFPHHLYHLLLVSLCIYPFNPLRQASSRKVNITDFRSISPVQAELADSKT